jgi:hypothetical protein
MKRRIDVNLDELDQVLDGARQAPLSDADYGKLKDALHALAAMLARPRNTEKTSAVLPPSQVTETDARASRIQARARHLDTVGTELRRLAVRRGSTLHTRL